MNDPVLIIESGHSWPKESIVYWLQAVSSTDPRTKVRVQTQPVPVVTVLRASSTRVPMAVRIR